MPYKEKEIEKVSWTIGEIANELNILTSAIRFWEKEIEMISPKRGRNRKRKFNAQDRAIIHDLARVRDILTIKGMIMYLDFKYSR